MSHILQNICEQLAEAVAIAAALFCLFLGKGPVHY